MAWELRGNKRYFYRSVRQDGHVKKIYYGAGQAGAFAANTDALRKAERDAAGEGPRQPRDQLEVAVAATLDLSQRCVLLATATLLAAGFHRAGRHNWRRWSHGRRILNRTQG